MSASSKASNRPAKSVVVNTIGRTRQYSGRVACTWCISCGLILQMSCVAWFVCVCLCLRVWRTRVSCAKTAELIKISIDLPGRGCVQGHVTCVFLGSGKTTGNVSDTV